MADYSRYKDRFDALMSVLNRMDERYAELPNAELHYRQDTILNLIRTLRQFAEGQFFFFYHGFNGGNGKYPRLNPQISASNSSVEFPPEHVLTSILDQIAADITVIQLAAEQRRLVSLPIQQPPLIVQGTEPKLDLLKVGDRLGTNAFWSPAKADRADDWGFKTVLTYLTDSVKVRVVPYSRVLLLGIPYSCKNDVRQLLAIPHEVGHFLFWYSFRQTADNLQRREGNWEGHAGNLLNVRELFYAFSKKPSKPAWAEEIFADVYSVLVGGPLAILTAMDVALEHSTDAFQDFDSNDTHPTPLIRPVLMMQALLKLNAQSAGRFGRFSKIQSSEDVRRIADELSPEKVRRIADELFALWQDKLQERHVTAFQGQKLSAQDFSLTPQEREVNALVDTAVRALVYAYGGLEENYGDPWGWSSKKFRDWSDAKGLETGGGEMVLAQINQTTEITGPTFDEVSTERYKENDAHDIPPKLWQEWVTTNGKGYFEEFPEKEIYAGEYETAMDPKNRPGQSWLPVFGAGGWTTEGPCANPPR